MEYFHTVLIHKWLLRLDHFVTDEENVINEKCQYWHWRNETKNRAEVEAFHSGESIGWVNEE